MTSPTQNLCNSMWPIEIKSWSETYTNYSAANQSISLQSDTKNQDSVILLHYLFDCDHVGVKPGG